MSSEKRTITETGSDRFEALQNERDEAAILSTHVTKASLVGSGPIYANAMTPLFNNSDNVVSFGSINKGTYLEGTQYNALDGHDVVFLPSNQQQAAEAGYDSSHSFNGGAGDDVIFGGGLNDLVFGSYGLDTVNGGGGDDEIHGGSGNDTINGGTGNDDLFGDVGIDTIDGGFGNDYIVGGFGNDVLNGSSGDDYILGDGPNTNGDDIIDGGSGNDVVQGGNGYDDIDGGIGNDILLGNDSDDWLRGGDGNDILLGGTGNDLIEGEDGDDELNGGDGDDQVYGYSGNDTLFGGDGNDEIIGDFNHEVGNDVIDGGSGDDLIYTGAGLDLVHGGSGDDDIRITGGTSVFAQVFGDDGNDAIRIGTGNYFVIGTVEADGGVGNDWISFDGAGQAIMNGGSGADEFVMHENGSKTIAAADVIADFEDGIDKLSIGEWDMEFDDLTIANDGDNCVISSKETGLILVVVENAAGKISEADFIV